MGAIMARLPPIAVNWIRIFQRSHYNSAMSRIVLIHWNPAEAEKCASLLSAGGHEVRQLPAQSGNGLRALRESPPDAVVIDLSRIPSHGSASAVFLRQQKATRHVPIIFVAGAPDKVARVRTLLPDAAYSEWQRILADIASAISHPVANPSVPGTMDGYSGTPLVKKLGIKPGCSVALLRAPRGFEEKLNDLPDGVRIRRRAAGRPDLILLFASSKAELEKQLPPAQSLMADRGGIWMVWPKKSSGLSADLSEKVVRAIGLSSGLVDYKICAIDQTWSGLLFARRRARKS
jgi:CheY-like chemotaxis protein